MAENMCYTDTLFRQIFDNLNLFPHPDFNSSQPTSGSTPRSNYAQATATRGAISADEYGLIAALRQGGPVHGIKRPDAASSGAVKMLQVGLTVTEFLLFSVHNPVAEAVMIFCDLSCRI